MKRLFFVAVVLFAGLSVNAQTYYFGDVNKNGGLDTDDISILSEMILGKRSADTVLGDVSKDGKLDVEDVTALIAYLLDNKTTEKAHDYVDLGLSVKWATCNVGATSPEGYGDYFAWGETSSKTNYASDWSNYFDTTDEGATFTKYTGSKTVLDKTEDAASVNWGGSWRMPTLSDWSDLRTKCTWTRTNMSGVLGYKIISNVDGYTNKYIFLPAAGYYFNNELVDAGNWGWYWSSTLDDSKPDRAWGRSFGWSKIQEDENARYYGRSVRPVCP